MFDPDMKIEKAAPTTVTATSTTTTTATSTTTTTANGKVCHWDPDVKIPKDAKVVLSASYEAEKKKKAEAKLRETQGRIW